MKDEMKEILDKPKILRLSYGNYIALDDYAKLKDYIANLKEELQYQKEAELEYNEKHIKLMQKYAEVQENYERIYNENCILREKHNITDISLLDENYNLQQENERLKEENKRIFSKVNDDELLISNAMNYAEAQDYKSRNEKARNFLKRLKDTFDKSDEMYELLDTAIFLLQGSDKVDD